MMAQYGLGGWNGTGELGNGTTTDSNVPIQVSFLNKVTSIAAGQDNSLAILNDSTVWEWGNIQSGINVPMQVSSLAGITAIADGWGHSIALKKNGTVWTWENSNSNVPVQVSSLTGITAITEGWWHSLALKNDGTLWAWGSNSDGQLGNGTNISSNVPVQVIGLCPIETNSYRPLAPIAANISICANNSANLSATGTGTLGWYSEAIGGTYLAGGTNYTTPALTTTTTFYVQDSTCGASATRTAVLVTVNPLPTIIAYATATNVCAGEAVTLLATGANNYNWSGGVNDGIAFVPATTTTYTVTGTDANNCSNIDPITINVNPIPTITAFATATNVCAGTSVSLLATRASTYNWSGGVTNGIDFVPSATTTFTVTGTDENNCSNTGTITIHVKNLLDVTTSVNGVSIAANQSGAAYQWLDCNNGN